MASETKFVTGAFSTSEAAIWTSPENITAEDSNYSAASPNSGELTSQLVGDMNGGSQFAIPGGSTIIGIVLEIKKVGIQFFGSPVLKDSIVRLRKAGVVVGDNKASGANWPSGVFTWVSYGGPVDLWGTTWTSAEINAVNFGAGLVGAAPGGLGQYRVDAYRITVYYNSPAGELTAIPDPSNDFGDVKVGVTSSPRNINLRNFSSTDIIVSALAFTGPFSAGGALPGLPFTLLANDVSGAVAVPIDFDPAVLGFVSQASALRVTHDGTNSPLDVQMQGTGVGVTSVFIVFPEPLVPLTGLVGSSTVKQFDPNDLDCEEAGSFRRLYDYGLSLTEKALTRIILQCEDLEQFTYSVSVATPNRPTVSPPAVTSGTGSGKVINTFANLEVSDDLLDVTVSRAADGGAMVINNMFHKLEPRGEYVERT